MPEQTRILASLSRGDESALQLLLERYWEPLLGYASALVSDRPSAEDLVQEAFVRLWERRAEWSMDGSLPALLYTITRNLAADHRRSTQRRVELTDHTPEMTSAFGPRDHAEEEELHRALVSALEALPPRRREVFLLARYHGLSHREIAQTMELSLQTVANHLNLALKDLRVALAPFLSDGGAGEVVSRR